jgi:hypothetical protein
VKHIDFPLQDRRKLNRLPAANSIIDHGGMAVTRVRHGAQFKFE